jgi:predicted nuclease of predicted toxin-antitoxin system
VRFLADMGLSLKVCHWLRTNGHDVVHLCEQGLQRLSNGDIFQKALAEQRVVLTFDLDFGEILASAGSHIVSVIVFRLHNTRASHVIERLQAVIESSTEVLGKGAIVMVEEGRHRVRQLPFKSD